MQERRIAGDGAEQGPADDAQSDEEEEEEAASEAPSSNRKLGAEIAAMMGCTGRLSFDMDG